MSLWKPLKYHRTEARLVMFEQHQEHRTIRKANFVKLDLPVYLDNPKYLLIDGFLRRPQMGDIVAKLDDSIRFGEVVNQDGPVFKIFTRSNHQENWAQPTIVHHNIIGMGERDHDGFVRKSPMPIKTMEEFNFGCEFFVERTYQYYFSRPPIEALNRDLILKFHRKMFGKIAHWGGKFRRSPMLVGRNNYKAPDWEDIRSLMDAFCEKYHEHVKNIATQTTFNAYVAKELGKIYVEFCDIHPFEDGNGRLSKFLIQMAVTALDSQDIPSFKWEIKRLSNRTDRAFEQVRKYNNYLFLSNIILRAAGVPFPEYGIYPKSP